MKRFRWDKKYLYWGVTAFCVIAAAIVFFMLLNHLGVMRSGLHRLFTILSPFVWGLVIAYLLYPLMRIYQRDLFTPAFRALLKKSRRADRLVPKLAKGFSVLLAEISLLIILGALLWMVVPQLYTSVEHIVVNSSEYIETADAWIAEVLTDYPEIESAVSGTFGNISEGLVGFATDNLLPEIKSLLSSLTTSVYSVARGIYNVIIGLVVSVYVLLGRETFSAHGKKVLYSVFSLEAAEKILEALHFTNNVFMGFISGKILDSLIIGILCYVGCSVLHIEYAVLVSCIVGVTNVIPFFGPLFGMIPSAFFILMESPMHALVFLIFVLLLQQFDGNILGPKILGSSVGIGGFWVLFAIIVGGGLFGFVGMLVGIPVFVVLYTLMKNLVNRKLQRSGLPVETETYRDIDHFDPVTGAAVGYSSPSSKRSEARRARDKQRLKFRRKKTGAANDAAPAPKETQAQTKETAAQR